MFAALVLSALLLQPVSSAPTVYVFTTTDCPISNRYAPEIARLAEKFKGRAKFVLVYPVRNDSPAMIRDHVKKFAYSMDTLRDTDQKLVKQTGVTVTPEVAVMQGDRVLYRGRIDDRYIELGRERAQATTHDLDDALTAVIAGKAVADRETQAVGCFLADLIK